MFEDALNYPREGESWLRAVLIGGGLQWLAVFIAFVSVLLLFVFVGFLTIWVALIPGILLAGYTLAVARGVLDSEPALPPFENWQELFVDGLKVVLVGIVYSIPFFVLAAVFVAVAATGSRARVAIALVLLLVAFVYAVLLAYLLPISLVQMAREDDVVAAFEVGVLRDVAFDGDYAVSWLLAIVVKLLGGVVNGILTAIVVGVLFVPFVQFYTRVSGTYLVTRGYMDALDLEFTPEAGGDHQTTLDEATDESKGLSYEPPEEDEDDSMPEAQTTVESDSDVDDAVSNLRDVEESRSEPAEEDSSGDADTGGEGGVDAESIGDGEAGGDAGPDRGDRSP